VQRNQYTYNHTHLEQVQWSCSICSCTLHSHCNNLFWQPMYYV